MMDGWIKLHRKLKESSFYHDSDCVHLWIHILLSANIFDKKFILNGSEIEVKAGQFITGRKKLSFETGIQESKIQRVLKVFEKCHMIEQQTNSRNRLITVVSWDRYQASEQQMNNKRTTDEHKQERKKEKNKELILSVVNYLNRKLGTKYKPSSKKTKECINARANEGYVLEHFKTVIDKKYNQWFGTDDAKYLRPETLFGNKFDGYLNQLGNSKSKPVDKLSFAKFQEAIQYKIDHQKPGEPFKFKNTELNIIIVKHPMINDYEFDSVKFEMAYKEYLEL